MAGGLCERVSMRACVRACVRSVSHTLIELNEHVEDAPKVISPTQLQALVALQRRIPVE